MKHNIFKNILILLLIPFLAFSQKRDSIVHGLRELGSRGMAGNLEVTNHSGIPLAQEQELNKAADDMKKMSEDIGITGFKVFDYATYPFLTFLGKEADGDAMMKAMEEKIAALVPAVPYYLLIGKVIDENAKITYKIKLKLPQSSSRPMAGDGTSGERMLPCNEFTTNNVNAIEQLTEQFLQANPSGPKRSEVDGVIYLQTQLFDINLQCAKFYTPAGTVIKINARKSYYYPSSDFTKGALYGFGILDDKNNETASYFADYEVVNNIKKFGSYWVSSCFYKRIANS